MIASPGRRCGSRPGRCAAVGAARARRSPRTPARCCGQDRWVTERRAGARRAAGCAKTCPRAAGSSARSSGPGGPLGERGPVPTGERAPQLFEARQIKSWLGQGVAVVAPSAPLRPDRQGAPRSTVACDEEGPASVQQRAALARLRVPGALRDRVRVVSLQEFNQDTDKESIRLPGRAAFRFRLDATRRER
jgi:hypothetical protein